MPDRRINISLIFIFVCVVTIAGDPSDYLRFLLAISFALILSYTSFVFNWLTLDGAAAASVFGTLAYGLGGNTGAAVVLIFFISGSLLSKDMVGREGFLDEKFRRNGKQVWCNGFWFAIWIIVWYATGSMIFLVAGVAAMAAANADTWATEIGGNRIKGATRLISNWKKVEPGTDGGISLEGTIASLVGSVIIAAAFWIFNQQAGIAELTVIIISGVAGSLADSYFGARLQNRLFTFSNWRRRLIQELYINNNLVNWFSTGIASLTGLILIIIAKI
ncbi:TIGR00297 family protein [Balneola sp. MJW-20]|uniref:DUF92 domain-containing protein n=1 Tax=Gracilimonas aurantiaca TaxID=3234185 RepID=UPI003467755B